MMPGPSLLAGMLLVATASAAGSQQVGEAGRLPDGYVLRALMYPYASAAAIAVAVEECIAQDGDRERLAALGWKPKSSNKWNKWWPAVAGDSSSKMDDYMRVVNGSVEGPSLLIPVVPGPLRCWIHAQTDDRPAVLKALEARFGEKTSDGGSPSWRIGDHSITLKFHDGPEESRLLRVEVYDLPQEKK